MNISGSGEGGGGPLVSVNILFYFKVLNVENLVKRLHKTWPAKYKNTVKKITRMNYF